MVTEAEQGVKSETQQTESEKTLMGEVEKLKTEVSSLIEKKKELEVNFSDFRILHAFINDNFRTSTKDHLLMVKTCVFD